MSTSSIKAVRGMNDILPDDTTLWQNVENCLRSNLHGFGYQEIRLPILEKTELFNRSVGISSDIVTKEMYTFADRNGENLTLRPEGTAGCIRAALQNGLIYNQIQRLWYIGPLFRHERPQKGRYRQFYQCGAEALGIAGSEIDVELILLTAQILTQLKLTNSVKLEVNSIGSIEDRKNYSCELKKFLNGYKNKLDPDSINRLTINPMRILDSKNLQTQEILANAPKITDFLDKTAKTEFANLCKALTDLNIEFTINPKLVRGLDYYQDTVFEWTTKNHSGAQNAVCAGGRYDQLIVDLGGKPSHATGFAFGLDRIILLLKELQLSTIKNKPHAYIIGDCADFHTIALNIATKLRILSPGLSIIVHAGKNKIKNQFNKAEKLKADYVLIFNQENKQHNTIALKPLHQKLPQLTIKLEDLFAINDKIGSVAENNLFQTIYINEQKKLS